MDEFEKPNLNKTQEKYREKVQSKIESCLYCQPYDDGEPVWIHGERIGLDDLFYDCNVPEKYWDKIMTHLFCPDCGLEGFELGVDIGIKTKFERDVDKHMDEVYETYGGEVRELEELLEHYPFLAYQNKFAQRIYKEINEKKLPVTSIKGKFYRARKVESSEVINTVKMHHPPLGKSLEGRFNHSGQSHLYLASDKETAIKEVIANEPEVLVWYQEFEMKKETSDILDLSFDWSYLTPSTSTLLLSLKIYNTIGRADRNKENWRPDYYLTRYIMDCAKKSGYNGIKYNSSKDNFSYDLVLFYPEKLKINAIGKPCIEIFLNKNYKIKFTSDLLDI